MIKSRTLTDRGRALEQEYFCRVDQQSIRKRHEELERGEKIAELNRITGVDADELGEHLFDVGIDSTTVAALTLTPLVFVAWADGSIKNDERQTVISTAIRQGVFDGPEAFSLVEQWLHTRPRKPFWDAWKHYAVDVHYSLPAAIANKLAFRTIFRATSVAKASGGVLGAGKISAAKQRILDEIAISLPERDETTIVTKRFFKNNAVTLSSRFLCCADSHDLPTTTFRHRKKARPCNVSKTYSSTLEQTNQNPPSHVP